MSSNLWNFIKLSLLSRCKKAADTRQIWRREKYAQTKSIEWHCSKLFVSSWKNFHLLFAEKCKICSKQNEFQNSLQCPMALKNSCSANRCKFSTSECCDLYGSLITSCQLDGAQCEVVPGNPLRFLEMHLISLLFCLIVFSAFPTFSAILKIKQFFVYLLSRFSCSLCNPHMKRAEMPEKLKSWHCCRFIIKFTLFLCATLAKIWKWS